MSSGFDYDSALSSPSSTTSEADKELQTFISVMQHRAQFQTQVNRLTSMCWDKCMSGYPPTKMDTKRSSCIENCTERFLDVSLLLRSRFQSMLSKLQQ
ncbi:unnamed protein product [Calicophoron daubneyi]|uniref:Mitochondrial import inner membrane translocase subunit n=1 Tax=Calicophoron daubneyi TaxID=300641 RepID=A0AAV2SYL7_CALDB